jgi:hypothetical protein
MMILTERPWGSTQVVIFARRNGVYDRPIRCDSIDLRIEDYLPPEIVKMTVTKNMLAKLPPVAGQQSSYLLANFGLLELVNYDDAEVARMIEAQQCILLPDGPQTPTWQYSQAPWWEYALAADSDGHYIKAPLKHRANEPSPEEIDELLDQVPGNCDTINVKSPINLRQTATL